MSPWFQENMPSWLTSRMPRWWPHWLCMNSLVFWMIIVAFAFFAAGWLTGRPSKPWLEFNWISAIYVHGSDKLDLSGVYDVDHRCDGRVIWRAETFPPEGTVLSSAPTKGWPDLSVGTHQYSDVIVLPPEVVDPVGWRVVISVVCGGGIPPIVVSPETRVVGEYVR